MRHTHLLIFIFLYSVQEALDILRHHLHIPHLYFTSCSIRKLLTHTVLTPHNVSVKQQDDNASQHGTEGKAQQQYLVNGYA